uniref:DUF2515 family protein n=1 Tax=uncultured Allobacillus sp. TaxID=1638025 RepID=UPI00259684AE|nr:DUF2515 family protein [uncultured Allobacillus sp.]
MVQLWIHYIKEQTEKHNIDNVSRTKAYLDFYERNPNIQWAFFASFVSRNAGWNMTDLSTETYQNLLSKQELKSLYLTYESANWYIFQDAYPQLLIYQLSLEQKRPMFFLLKHFHVSAFMEKMWYEFYKKKDLNQLLYAQIINEQNLIQHPIIENEPYQKKVFRRIPYHLQSIFHMNAVLLPTLKGDLYGDFVPRFKQVTKRIQFGKKIASILFDSNHYPLFKAFADQIEVTGSRTEYEQFLNEKCIETPTLDQAFANTKHQLIERRTDWHDQKRVQKRWFKDVSTKEIKTIGEQFYAKRAALENLTNTIEKAKDTFAEKK